MQIDGLSRVVLEQGLASGYMPFLKRLLRHGYRLEPMAVGLPTSTPAFQMAAMYGVRPDIPGFHYFDRERQADIHFPRRGHAALVEARQAAGRRGILHGGSTYGCVFTGGADNNLFSFASLTRPSGRGLLAALSPFVVVAWVCLKNLLRTVVELVRAVARLVAHPARARQGWRWLTIKIGFSLWVRGFFTLAVSRDLYAGIPAVYVNYLDYDVAAHAFGPGSRRALHVAAAVDRAIRQLWRVARRVPEHRYDLYVLSDHGQAPCTPYLDLTGGRRFERWIFDQFLDPGGADRGRGAPRGPGWLAGSGPPAQATPGLFQHFLNYLDEDFLRRREPEAHEQDGVRVIAPVPTPSSTCWTPRRRSTAPRSSSGSPGSPSSCRAAPAWASCSRGPTTGRSASGAASATSCASPSRALSRGRPDAALVVQRHRRPDGDAERRRPRDLRHRCPRGPRLVHSRGGRPCRAVARGAAHLHRAPRAGDLPSPIRHPVQLYDHFIRYQERSPG